MYAWVCHIVLSCFFFRSLSVRIFLFNFHSCIRLYFWKMYVHIEAIEMLNRRVWIRKIVSFGGIMALSEMIGGILTSPNYTYDIFFRNTSCIYIYTGPRIKSIKLWWNSQTMKPFKHQYTLGSLYFCFFFLIIFRFCLVFLLIWLYTDWLVCVVEDLCYKFNVARKSYRHAVVIISQLNHFVLKNSNLIHSIPKKPKNRNEDKLLANKQIIMFSLPKGNTHK